MRVCHFRTRDRNLSDVKSSPWKFVRQFLPCISSTLSLTFRNAWSSSFWRSASDTSKILPFKASFAFFRPVVLLTNVLPTLETCQSSTNYIDRLILLPNLKSGWRLDMSVGSRHEGLEPTFTEYQSLRVKVSWARFFSPFFPLESRLFLSYVSFRNSMMDMMPHFPTAMGSKTG